MTRRSSIALLAGLTLLAACAESPTSPMAREVAAPLVVGGAPYLPGEQQPVIALPNLANWAIYPAGMGQNLAQTFTPSQDQWLGYLQLPVGCAAGVLLNVKIRDGLGGTILYESNHAGLPQTVTGTFQLLQVFDPAVSPLGIGLQANHTYAFEVAAFPGPGAAGNSCGMPVSPAGNSYAGGRGFYRDPIDGTAWIALPSGAPTADQDLPFITLVQASGAPAPVTAVLAGSMWFKHGPKDWRLGADTRFEGTVPVGRVTFRDQEQLAISFVAEDINSIVITGTRAVVQARGFISGWSGTFTIVAVLRDGGSGVVNGARVRITDASGNMVFDNKVGQPVDSDSVTPRIESHLTIQRNGLPAMPVATVQVTLAAGSLSVGQTTQATAVLRDANGVVLTGRAIGWITSNAAVATISAAGLVTAVAPGVAEIVATGEGRSGGAVATVLPATSAPAGLPVLAAGSFHSCGIASSGAAFCWGWGGFGQLGNGSNANSPTAVAVSGGLSFSVLGAGRYHTCGLTKTGAAYCWGDNSQGQLGSGSAATWSPIPVVVSGGRTFVALAVGELHSCALTGTGATYCWGFNGSGRLGDGSTVSRSIPVVVSGGASFHAIGTGLGHTCGFTSAGAAYCWGLNDQGQLGNGSTTSSSTPVAVLGGLSFTSLSAGGLGSFTCGLVSSGAAYCWGGNANNQLGNGSATSSAIPMAVSGGLRFGALGSGQLHTCGFTITGAAYCWGSNFYGAFGNGTSNWSSVPVPVSGGLGFSAIAAGSSHTCALTTAGAAYCWGLNRDGQVGNGSITDVYAPVPVSAWP